VTIPVDVVSTLLRTGTLQKTDFIGAETYTLADGSKVPSATFRIRSLTVNKIEIQNIKAGVTPLLLPVICSSGKVFSAVLSHGR
jgi:hypothetical protein